MTDMQSGSSQGPVIERPPKPLTIINLAQQNSYRRVENVCDLMLRNGELADYDDELANSVKIAKEIAAGLTDLAERSKVARQYAEMLEAHIESGGTATARNVRDLIQFINELA